MNFNTFGVCAIALFAFNAMAAEDVRSPDGFDLTKLYDKFETNSAISSAEKIMLEDFNAAMNKNTPPKRLFIYAKKGNPVACNLVGVLFDAGKGVKQDSSKAIKWFTYCANTNPHAAYNLAVIYADGRGVIKNAAKAEPYFNAAWNGLQTPQAAIRLAYWYRSQKDWNSEWEWLKKLEKIKRYPRHWGYLMGEMIINRVAPVYDMSKANIVLYWAVQEYSVSAAKLLATSYGEGLETAPNKIAACQMGMLASAFSGKHSADVGRWVDGLNEEEKTKCRSLADDWLKMSTRPAQLDFKSLSVDPL